MMLFWLIKFPFGKIGKNFDVAGLHLTTMESNNIYTKYKSCIHTACSLFKRYEKYRNCFGNGAMDSQMNRTFYRIVVSYSKMTDSFIKLVMPPREKTGLQIAANEYGSSVDGKALFLEYT